MLKFGELSQALHTKKNNKQVSIINSKVVFAKILFLIEVIIFTYIGTKFALVIYFRNICSITK